MEELESNAPDDIEIILICNKIDLLDNQLNDDGGSDGGSDGDGDGDGSDGDGDGGSDDGEYKYNKFVDSSLAFDQEKLIRNAIEVAANKRIPFYMTSAKSGECVKKAFEELVSQVLHNSAILEKMYAKREKQLIQKGRKVLHLFVHYFYLSGETDEFVSYFYFCVFLYLFVVCILICLNLL